MKPQKILLFDEKGTDESHPGLLVDCPICDTRAGLWCGRVSAGGPSRSHFPRIFFIHEARSGR